MAVRRAFKTDRKNRRKPFDISIDGEVFTCRGGISGGILLKLIGRFSSFGGEFGEGDDVDDENVDVSKMSEISDLMRDFFSIAIVKKDQERFFNFIDDPDQEIEMELLMDMMSWLMQVYSERPLATSGDSTKNS